MRKRRPTHEAVVVRKAQLTPNMMRVTLGGPGLAHFPLNQESGYIKLHVPEHRGSDDTVVRTYTVRAFDAETKEMAVEFVMHDVAGPASEWARHCEAGDTVHFGGPGPTKLVDFSADWFLLVG
ncbi:MAG: siderophore-interacting protein, partial [Pseudomonadota bacterium]